MNPVRIYNCTMIGLFCFTTIDFSTTFPCLNFDNLRSLFVGSEGTLGMVTQITLKLAVVPAETTVAVVTFPSIRDAAAAASKIMRAGVPVGAMKLMCEV